jgi:hypothetical protein
MSYLSRKCISFIKKSYITLNLNIRQHGSEVNLLVSRAQRTFGPGRRQQTYCYIWRGCNCLLSRNQVSTSEVIHLYPDECTQHEGLIAKHIFSESMIELLTICSVITNWMKDAGTTLGGRKFHNIMIVLAPYSIPRLQYHCIWRSFLPRNALTRGNSSKRLRNTNVSMPRSVFPYSLIFQASQGHSLCRSRDSRPEMCGMN